MNSHNRGKTGGASIIPSARRSIHAHRPAHDIIMGRYGIHPQGMNIKERQTTSPRQQDGLDEVDNVISKFASSPLQSRNSPRKTSLSSPNKSQIDSSDKDDNILAKSLPAKLPSHSYYREEMDDKLGQYRPRNADSSGDASRHPEEFSPESSRQNNSFNRSGNSSFDYSSRFEPRYPESEQHRNRFQYLGFILVPILALFYTDVLNTNGRVKPTNYDLYRFSSDMKGLGERYKINDDSILQVQTGISTIYEKEDTGSFVFTYNSESNNFNQMHFNKFMDDIASTAARFLRNDTASVRHLAVDSGDLTMKSHSELVSRYRADVAKTGVMLVREVNRLPSPLAMAFHYYCDEYNPLVKKSAIFFTLDLATCSKIDTKTSHAHVEKCLTNKWNGGVPEDNIQPLLTRVVSVVIDVTSAF